MLITLNDRQLALGLEWAQLSSPTELRAEKKKAKAVLSAALRQKETRQIWYGTYGGQAKGTVFAGALVLTLVETDVIICVKVSDTKSWACVLMDGAPVVGHDLIVDSQSARGIVMEWTAQFAEHQIIGDLQGSKMSLSELMQKLEENLKHDKVLKKRLNEFKLRKDDSKVYKSLALASLLCVPIVATIGFQKWQEYKAQQLSSLSAQERARRQLQTEAEAKEQKRLALLKYQQDVAAKRLAFEQEATESAEPVWNAWRTVLNRIPLSLYSYVPQILNCDTSVCKLSWQGQGAFVRPVHKALLPGVLPDADPKITAISEFKFELPAVQKEKHAARIKVYKTPEEFYMAMISDLMRIPGMQFSTPQPVLLPVPNDVDLSPEIIGYRGQWRVLLSPGTARLDLLHLEAAINNWPMKPSTMLVTSVSHSATFTIEGNYVFPMSQ